MPKELLVDYTPFSISLEHINESIKQNNGKLIVSGVLQRAGAKNANGRIYPKPILEREAQKYKKIQITEKRALGELDHPESSVVNLSNVSHNITDLWWNGNDLYGTLEVLNTPAGKILKELFSSGIKIGISSRGLGSVKPLSEDDSVEVQEDYEILCWDCVSSPSTQGAFISPINENLIKENKQSKNISKYLKINKIITDIICETKGICPCNNRAINEL